MTLNDYAAKCHAANIKWWQNIETGEPLERNKGELLCLIHSDAAVEAALKAVADNLHRQDREWEVGEGEPGETLLTAPDGSYVSLDMLLHAALSAARPHLVTDRGAPSEARGLNPMDRHVAEEAVPQSVIEAFYHRYGEGFDLSRDDHEWRNTWRFKHPHIQSSWEGWRDGYLALSALCASDALAPAAGQMVAIKGEPVVYMQPDGETWVPDGSRLKALLDALPPPPAPLKGPSLLPLYAAPIPERVNAVDLREAAHRAHTAGMTAPTVKEHDDLFEEASVLSRAADWLDRFAHLPRDRKGE